MDRSSCSKRSRTDAGPDATDKALMTDWRSADAPRRRSAPRPCALLAAAGTYSTSSERVPVPDVALLSVLAPPVQAIPASSLRRRECGRRWTLRRPECSRQSNCYTPAFPSKVIAIFPGSISDLQHRLADQHYVADRGLAVSLFLALRLKRPLFLEGEAGVGKTALAGAAAAALGTDLIRLQCYEGLDVGHALYEWDYARQLLELRILDATDTLNRESARRELYSEAFLIKRPLLQAIDPLRTRPAVLLIDEIDRADEEFEGFLLELLAEFQITIPELGTLRASGASAGHPHVQSHARGARRAEAPVPVSMD